MYVFTPNTLIESAKVNANFDEAVDILNNPNPYKFSAYLASNQSLGASYTVLDMSTEEYDTNSNYSTSSKAYTVPVTGYYAFKLTVLLQAQAATAFIIALGKNSSSEWRRLVEIPNTTGNITISGSVDAYLAAGDVIYPLGYSVTTKTLLSSAQYSRFSGHLITV